MKKRTNKIEIPIIGSLLDITHGQAGREPLRNNCAGRPWPQSGRSIYDGDEDIFIRLRALLSVSLLFAACASGDEADNRQVDRVAIDKVITSLNEPAPESDVFTKSDGGLAQFQELRSSTPGEEFRIVGPLGQTAPSVTISHEPWGEAIVTMPVAFPDVIRRRVVFVSADVALADGACTLLPLHQNRSLCCS